MNKSAALPDLDSIKSNLDSIESSAKNKDSIESKSAKKSKNKIELPTKTPKEAIFAILLAALLFALMGMFVKDLSLRLPSVEVSFARNFFGLIWVVVALLLKPPIKGKYTGGRPFVLALRGLAGGSAMIAYFYNMSVMPLGTAFAFSYTSPIFIAIMSIFIMKRGVSLGLWAAILCGFLGVLLISNPSASGLSAWGFAVGIYSGLGAAAAYMSVAELAKAYDPRVIIGSLMVFGSLLPLLLQLVPYELAPIACFERFVWPSAWDFVLLCGMGFVSTYAQIFLTKAYGLGYPPVIAAFSYAAIFFATFGGIILGDRAPQFFVILGMICIVLGGILAGKSRS